MNKQKEREGSERNKVRIERKKRIMILRSRREQRNRKRRVTERKIDICYEK